jgi:hypothetical protein
VARALALLILLSALGACNPTPDNARAVDGRAALAAVLAFYTGAPAREAQLWPVYVVPKDCMGPEGFPGFWFLDGCRGGYADLGGHGLYLAETGSFSDHLPHEAFHLLGHMHDPLPTWPADSAEGRLIAAARMLLWVDPVLNHIPHN